MSGRRADRDAGGGKDRRTSGSTGRRSSHSHSRIVGLGHYVPERRVTSAELEQRLGLEAGWIVKRTGVAERRFAAPHEAVSDLAVAAGRRALDAAGLQGGDIDLILLATSTPDHLLPPSAPLVAQQLGSRAAAMDLAAACTGFVYALSLADGFVRTQNGRALVIGANVLSRRINLDDRASSILFGDGAGALVLAGDAEGSGYDYDYGKGAGDDGLSSGLLGQSLGSQGAHYDLIKFPAGGSRQPFSAATSPEDCAIKLSDGGAAFAAAIHSMAGTAEAAVANAGLSMSDVDWWIPHQANRRIIEAAGHKIGMPLAKTLFTIGEWGNSSAATIPLTLAHYWRRAGAADALKTAAAEALPGQNPGNEIRDGNIVLMTAVGAGFTEGSIVYRL